MIFKKPDGQVPTSGDNGKPKSKWQVVIDHMDAAHKHMGEAMNALSMINFDLQKGADFIARYRESLVKTIQEAGGEIEQGSVEEAIRDYVPKAIQRERVDEAN
jgi:hypothetical protein